MVSKVERFWILFILRFAIGSLLLIASLSQWFHAGGPGAGGGPAKFAADLSNGFKTTWLADVGALGVTGLDVTTAFLHATPYVLGACAVLVLTGLLLRTGLRVAALMFVCLGLGKYIQGDVTTMANDFLLAAFACLALFVLAFGKRPPAAQPA